MDDVFKALADPSRRDLLDRLNTRDGQTLGELCSGLAMTRQSVSKHLAILEGANLVTTVWHGREKRHYLNAAPINAIADRWLRSFDRRRVQALADLKAALEAREEPPMPSFPVPDHPSRFVYRTVIRTTPDKLWQALTTTEFTRQYWDMEFITDWQPGSPMIWIYNGTRIEDPEQKVLEADPGKRLTFTWHGVTPEFSEVVGVDAETRATLVAEPRSVVTFDIQPLDGSGDLVQLTVTHTCEAPDSTLIGMVTEGWPPLLSNLKTLLETGVPFPA
ncbi:MAG TPA: metalloregulator ArsR/SmtB family transcription factor [Thermomicrobiales bacterium]|nr:metalloregulator ArsR/SmtB family transcription factor [Thermomicrobiales bacterium]